MKKYHVILERPKDNKKREGDITHRDIYKFIKMSAEYGWIVTEFFEIGKDFKRYDFGVEPDVIDGLKKTVAK